MSRRRIALVAALATAALPASAHAAAWIPAQPVGDGGGLSGVQVSASGAGAAWAAWTLNVEDGESAIYAAPHPPGGVLGAAVRLSAPGTDAAGAPAVAANAGGRFAVSWTASDASDADRVELAIGTVGGLTERATIAPAQAGPDAADAKVAVAPGGRVLVAWVTGDDPARVRAAIKDPGGPVQILPDLSTTGVASDVGVVAGPDGGFLVALAKSSGTTTVRTSIEAVTVSPAGAVAPRTLEQATLVSDDDTGVELGSQVTGPSIAAAPNGAAVIAYERTITSSPPATPTDPDDDATAQAIRAASGTTALLGAPGDVSGAATDAAAPAAAGGGQGTLAVAWATGAGTALAVAPPGGGFGGPETVAAGADPAAAVMPDGSVVVAYVGAGGVAARVRAPTGGFGPAAPLSPAGPNSVTAAADREGNAVLGYAVPTGAEGLPGQARVAAYDAAPPAIRALRVPGEGVAGSPLTLGLDVDDSWSGIGGVRWALGDGRETAQREPAVTYDAAGDYRVAATVVDGAGNSAAGERTLRIGPAGQPAPAEPTQQTAESRDLAAPLVSGLRAERTLFLPSAGSRAAVLRAGSGFRFMLSEPARVTITIMRLAYQPGRRSRCLLAGPPPRTRPRIGLAGRVQRDAGAGLNRIAFSGRVDGRRLPRGRYAARVSAIDAAGNRGRAATVNVTIC